MFLRNQVYAFHSTLSYAAWKLINTECTSIFFSQHFPNICITVKIWTTVDLCLQKRPRYSPIISSAQGTIWVHLPLLNWKQPASPKCVLDLTLFVEDIKFSEPMSLVFLQKVMLNEQFCFWKLDLTLLPVPSFHHLDQKGEVFQKCQEDILWRYSSTHS